MRRHWALVVAGVTAAGAAARVSRAAAQPAPTCGSAPAVAGFRLGQSVPDVVRRFPRLPLPVGWERTPLLALRVEFTEYAGQPRRGADAALVDSTYGSYIFLGHPPGFERVGQLTLDFRAGRLVSGRVIEEGAPRVPTFDLDALTGRLSDSLGLPKRWRAIPRAELRPENFHAGRRVDCPTFRFEVATYSPRGGDLVYAVGTGRPVTSDARIAAIGTLADLEREANQRRDTREAADTPRFADSAYAADPRRPRWAYLLAREAFAACLFHLELVGPGRVVPVDTAGRRFGVPDPSGGDSLRAVRVQARVLRAEPAPTGRPTPDARTCDPARPDRRTGRPVTFPSAVDSMVLYVAGAPTAPLTTAAAGTRVEALYANVFAAAGLYYLRREDR